MRLIRRLIVVAAACAPVLAWSQPAGRGTPTGAMTMPMDGAAAAKITMTASMTHGELLLDIGPFDVAAAMPGGHDDDHEMKMPEAPPLWALVPATGWLHGYRVDLIDKDGHPVPQALLHHVNVIATQRRELFSGIMLRVAAAGPETGTVSIPSLIGYEAHAGDTLLVRAMLRPGDRAYEGVRIRVHFPFTSTKALIGDFTISPFYMDVTPPAGGHAFDIPVGHSEWFWEAKPAIAGRIIGFSGHVHRYATLFKFEDRTANKVIWQTHPDTTADGEPKQIPIKRFLFTLGYPIHPDHVYRLTVVYDNPTGAPVIDGGMGALGGVFRPTGGVPWPAIDPNDKDYKLDVWAMWRP
ncbi:MAG: hypothetical protein ACHQSE_10855 [Gemmatimonadales bacterium]